MTRAGPTSVSRPCSDAGERSRPADDGRARTASIGHDPTLRSVTRGPSTPTERIRTMDWFERITGFAETDYAGTQQRLSVVDGRLRSSVSKRDWGIGTLETPTLAALRERAGRTPAVASEPRLRRVVAEVRALHADPANGGALFQVASQFNLLEMTGPDVTPEDGVTRYRHDRTQGPACAMAAGAATIWRNYLLPVRDLPGQRRDAQVDCLADLGAALGNAGGSLWEMRNGYALCRPDGLARVEQRLAAADEAEVDALRARLRIGWHRNVEVTDAPGRFVSQAFCSALPVAYSAIPAARWQRFATLVLEAAYEATLLAARIAAIEGGSATVFLTRLGGGAFGNDPRWIDAAIDRAVGCAGAGLDLRLVERNAAA